MNILALETSFGACSAAVLRADGVLHAAYRAMDRGHAEALMPMVEAVVRESGLAFRDIDRIAATTGPGSFTGVRIAVAAARGLALATGAELYGASALAVMAREVHRTGHWPETTDRIAIARDARRGALYLAVYGRDGLALVAPHLAALDPASDALPEVTFAAGDGAALLAEAVARRGVAMTAILPGLEATAAALAELAREGEAQASISPLYFRPPDAKPQTGKRVAILS